MTALVKRTVDVDGWTLDVTSDEPRIRDVDLAERAGLKQPRDIRRVIERSREELEEFGHLDMRVHCARISKPRGGYEEREVSEFWLNEHQATTILLQLRTPEARRVRVGVVKVFIAVRRGQLAWQQQVPTRTTYATVGGCYLRDEMRNRCTMTARHLGVSVHRIHGLVRKQFTTPGIYQLDVSYYGAACGLLEDLAFGRVLLPAKATRQLPAANDQAQEVLPFPTVVPGGAR